MGVLGFLTRTSDLVDGVLERMGVRICCGCVGCCAGDDEWCSFLQTASLVMEGGRKQSRAEQRHVTTHFGTLKDGGVQSVSNQLLFDM
jgi:hypothetical protein